MEEQARLIAHEREVRIRESHLDHVREQVGKMKAKAEAEEEKRRR